MAEPTIPPVPQGMGFVDCAAELCECVHARAQAAERIGEALGRGDAPAVAALAPIIEHAAAQMARAAAAFQQTPPPADVAAAINQTLAGLLARLKAADQRTRALLGAAGVDSLAGWLAQATRQAPSLVDELLAAPWDRRRDLVVLGLPASDPLVAALTAAGQQRIFCLHGPTRIVEASGTRTVRAFASLAELEAACEDIAWPPPTRARVAGDFGSQAAHISGRVGEATSRVAQMVEAFGRFGRAFLSAGARNLGAIAQYPSAAALNGLFRGVPALIVAAGPSLDRHLADLHRWKGRAVIIAINRSVKALLQAGVAPDIALAIDPLNLSSHFAGVRPGDITALGLGAAVVPALFEVPADATFTMASSPDIEAWIYEPLKEDAALPFGGTVAHTALQLALRMGCAPITVIGQDFALDGTKFYADGAADGGRRAELRGADKDGAGTLDLAGVTDRAALSAGMPELEKALPRLGEVSLVRVPGYFGGEVSTTPTMQMQLAAYRQMAVAAARRTRLVNATEGGAFIEGMEHRPFAEMTATLGAVVPIAAKLRAALELRQRSQRTGRMAKGLRALDERLVALAALAAELLPAARAGQLASADLARFRARAAQIPFLRYWALGTARELGEGADEALALLLAAGEAQAVYGPAIAAALARLGGR